MYARWKCPERAKVNTVVPDHHRRVTRYHAGIVLERNLAVQFIDDGHGQSEAACPRWQQRTGGQNKCSRIDACTGRELNCHEALAVDHEVDDFVAQKLDAVRTGTFQ